MKIYIPSIVKKLQEFYGDLLYNIDSYPTIPTHLTALAQRQLEGVQQVHPAILSEISNYHKDYLGKKEQINPKIFSLADCQQTIANEYGFPNWQAVQELGNLQYDFRFEQAVNVLLSGKVAELKELLTTHPYLLSATSRYGHQATLLHYVASNGVEFWRQQVPLNLPEITSYLLSVGANKEATMKVYGGEFHAYALLVTSAHPHSAGLIEVMKKTLGG